MSLSLVIFISPSSRVDLGERGLHEILWSKFNSSLHRYKAKKSLCFQNFIHRYTMKNIFYGAKFITHTHRNYVVEKSKNKFLRSIQSLKVLFYGFMFSFMASLGVEKFYKQLSCIFTEFYSIRWSWKFFWI